MSKLAGLFVSFILCAGTSVQAKTTILYLGDSQSLEILSDLVYQNLSANPEFSVHMYSVCGSSPATWRNRYRQRCGYYQKTPTTTVRDIWTTRNGRMSPPQPRAAPSLIEILNTVDPDIVIAQQGDNLFPEKGKRWTESYQQYVKNNLQWMQQNLESYRRQSNSPRKIIWVTPPDERDKKNRGQIVGDTDFEKKMPDLMQIYLSGPNTVVLRSLDYADLARKDSDGTHLSRNGYQIWSEFIVQGFQKVFAPQ